MRSCGWASRTNNHTSENARQCSQPGPRVTVSKQNFLVVIVILFDKTVNLISSVARWNTGHPDEKQVTIFYLSMPQILHRVCLYYINYSLLTWDTNYTGIPVLFKSGNPIYNWYFMSNKDNSKKYISWG